MNVVFSGGPIESWSYGTRLRIGAYKGHSNETDRLRGGLVVFPQEIRSTAAASRL